MLLTAKSPAPWVMVKFPAGRSRKTSSAALGTAPVLQLLATSQRPLASTFQKLLAGSTRSSRGSKIKRDQPLLSWGSLPWRDLERRPIGFRSHNGNFMED